MRTQKYRKVKYCHGASNGEVRDQTCCCKYFEAPDETRRSRRSRSQPGFRASERVS